MGMKLVKKTDEYSVYQRRDQRYAVLDAKKNPINGADKVRILVEEELLKETLPAAPVAEEAAAVEPAAEETNPADAAPAEEAAAEEPAAEETATDAPGDENK